MNLIEPRHVRVARALGWTEIHDLGEGRHVRWCGRAPVNSHCKCHPIEEPTCELLPTVSQDGGPLYAPLPPFGDETPEGWACTGPLIVRVKAYVYFSDAWGWCAQPDDRDLAYLTSTHYLGAGPCEALAALVEALGAKGRL